MSFSHIDYKSKPFLATPAIGKMLDSGCLNLFLGAGVSKGFGLPQWALLIARILGRGNDANFLKDLQKKSDKDLSKMIDLLDKDDAQEDYLFTVHEALYKSVESNLSDQLSQSPLLLAVAALLTGSCRGRIDRVFTYNYDDLLEQYLKMIGHAVCTRVDAFDFSTKADVEINHIHGFLPQSWKRGDKVSKLILSEKSYTNRRSEIDAKWSSSVEQSFYSKSAIFIGLSGDDGSMLDVLKRAKNKIMRVADTDYHGYWLMTQDAYNRNGNAVLDVGMCPIPIDKNLLPKFVFEVCQKASQ